MPTRSSSRLLSAAFGCNVSAPDQWAISSVAHITIIYTIIKLWYYNQQHFHFHQLLDLKTSLMASCQAGASTSHLGRTYVSWIQNVKKKKNNVFPEASKTNKQTHKQTERNHSNNKQTNLLSWGLTSIGFPDRLTHLLQPGLARQNAPLWHNFWFWNIWFGHEHKYKAKCSSITQISILKHLIWSWTQICKANLTRQNAPLYNIKPLMMTTNMLMKMTIKIEMWSLPAALGLLLPALGAGSFSPQKTQRPGWNYEISSKNL